MLRERPPCDVHVFINLGIGETLVHTCLNVSNYCIFVCIFAHNIYV